MKTKTETKTILSKMTPAEKLILGGIIFNADLLKVVRDLVVINILLTTATLLLSVYSFL